MIKSVTHQITYTPPPFPHPHSSLSGHSSLSHELRSIGFLRVRPGLVSPFVRPITMVYLTPSRVVYTPPPSPRPRSSLSHTLKSFGFVSVRPGLVSPSTRLVHVSVTEYHVYPLHFPLPWTRPSPDPPIVYEVSI